ncbi:MAG: teichuronic acid biosynthesis glycosyltransferase TuaC [Gemmatimonadales bacterium]|nr:teichuronic acid biosynthesis glycosyltransferase TuaC [Gemmatimonadales bacterium]
MTSNIKVLMVTSDWLWNSWGGPAVFVARQAEFLRRAGVEVDLFPFRGSRRPGNYAAAWREVQRRLRHGSYDLVHAQFGQSGLTALPKRIPLVVTFRGDDLEGIIGESGRYIPAGWLLRLVSRTVSRQADAAIVVSAHMKRHLPASVEAHVLPSGLNLDQFRPEPQEQARARLGLPLEGRLVAFVGNPDLARKRYSLAQEAVAIVSRTMPTQLLVGWGKPHHEIVALLNACDAMVFTSMQEGSPNAVKEALACNLPVVSVAVGDVALRLEGVKGCELCPNDRAETIAAALERVLRRGGRSEGRAAVQDLDERFLTERLIDIYRSVLPRSKPMAKRPDLDLLSSGV